MITIAIILPILVLAIKLILNYRLWLHAKPVQHTKEWIVMAAACLPSIVIFTIESKLVWLAAAPLSALMIAFFIWIFFDGIYNKLRGFNWWFTGSNDKDDAKADNFLQGLKLWQHIVIKLVGFSVFITTYILTK